MRSWLTGLVLAVAAATTIPAHAQTKSILNEVLERGSIRIAIQGGVPPYSVIKGTGEPEGYDIDIGKAIAATLKVKPEWVVVDTPGRITALQTHKADITIADFTANTPRSLVIAFTEPYIVVAMQFTVLASRDDIKTIKDLDKPEMKI